MNAIRLVGYFFASFLLFPIGTNADEALYQSRCAACHGNSGEGLEAMSAPAIAGLDQQYLTRQLEHFRSGVRGSQTSDSQGVLMAQISKSLLIKTLQHWPLTSAANLLLTPNLQPVTEDLLVPVYIVIARVVMAQKPRGVPVCRHRVWQVNTAIISSAN